MDHNQTLAQLMEDVTKKAGDCAKAINEGKPQKEIKTLRKAASDAMTKYNEQVAFTVYKEWAEKGDAIQTALRTLYVPGAKKISYKSNASEYTYVEVSDAKIKINLPEMQTVIGIQHFHEEDWFTKVGSLAWIIANAVNKNLGDNPAFAYRVSEAAKVFRFSDAADITSIKSIVSALQQTADGILFIPTTTKKGKDVNAIKMTSASWWYIRESMTKQGKEPGHVDIYGEDKMSELVADAMHVIMTTDKFVADQV